MYCFYLWYVLHVFVDIVPVSFELPFEVGQDQFFEEEEQQFLGGEGKWTSPSAYSIFVPIICMIIHLTFMFLHKDDGNTFLRTY